eukprot:Hpha_TRINITY_DN9047_c0_g1::TRINITY_DN9047_c0_g1_i1::g.141982::m.141982
MAAIPSYLRVHQFPILFELLGALLDLVKVGVPQHPGGLHQTVRGREEYFPHVVTQAPVLKLVALPQHYPNEVLKPVKVRAADALPFPEFVVRVRIDKTQLHLPLRARLPSQSGVVQPHGPDHRVEEGSRPLSLRAGGAPDDTGREEGGCEGGRSIARFFANEVQQHVLGSLGVTLQPALQFLLVVERAVRDLQTVQPRHHAGVLRRGDPVEQSEGLGHCLPVRALKLLLWRFAEFLLLLLQRTMQGPRIDLEKLHQLSQSILRNIRIDHNVDNITRQPPPQHEFHILLSTVVHNGVDTLRHSRGDLGLLLGPRSPVFLDPILEQVITSRQFITRHRRVATSGGRGGTEGNRWGRLILQKYIAGGPRRGQPGAGRGRRTAAWRRRRTPRRGRR